MGKVAIVYWSGTGNTEMMANAVAEGARSAGAKADMYTPSDFTTDVMSGYEKIAFGCPSMGAEQLEEGEFEPMFSALEPELGGKKLALFGSYGWGDGEWMRNWEDACRSDGAELIAEGLIVNETPDDDALENCKGLGASLAQS